MTDFAASLQSRRVAKLNLNSKSTVQQLSPVTLTQYQTLCRKTKQEVISLFNWNSSTTIQKI